MEKSLNTRGQVPATKDQEVRDHIAGSEGESRSLSLFEEESLRNQQIMEEIQQMEQRSMREYGDYTLTILDFAREFDLEKQHEWTSAMWHVYHQDACESIACGCDIGHPARVLVILGQSRLVSVAWTELLTSLATAWSSGTPQSLMEDTKIWEPLKSLLDSQPQAYRIALNPPGLFRSLPRTGGCYLQELIVVQGNDELFNPPDPLHILDLQTLEYSRCTTLNHDGPTDFAGYSQGITPNISGMRTIAIILYWVDQDKRAALMDPEQAEGSDRYEKYFGAPLRRLEQNGARLQSYMCYMRRWYPYDEPKASNRCCTMM